MTPPPLPPGSSPLTAEEAGRSALSVCIRETKPSYATQSVTEALYSLFEVKRGVHSQRQ